MATTVPSSSFAICLTDPMGEEATSPNRDTQTAGGSMSLRHKRKHAALQDTAESPPAAVIDPLVGLDRPTRQTRNTANALPLEASDPAIMPVRVSKRLSMKADEPISLPMKNGSNLSKTARMAAARKAGAPPPLPTLNEDAVLEDSERPRRAQKLPKRLQESILLEKKTSSTPTVTAPSATAPKPVQKAAAPPAAITTRQQKTVSSPQKNIPDSSASAITLGCSKCRFALKGCGTCKAKAAAAGANVQELLEAAERAKLELKQGKNTAKAPAQLPKKQQPVEKKKGAAIVQQDEQDTAARRVSARRLGLDPAPVDVIDKKKDAPVVVEPLLSVEKRRGRKPASKTTLVALADPAAEPVAMEIDQPETVPAPALVQEEKELKKKAASPPKANASPALKQKPEPEQQQQVVVPEQEEEQANEAPWWNPLDPAKVSQAQAALHVSSASVPGQELPLCRDRQITAIDTWLADRLQTAQGGSLYISGLPGTGKSLTALELVRRCGRHLSTTAATSSSSQRGCALPPPALIAVNCMRFSEPKQAVERILAGYHTACRQVDGKEIDPLVQVPDEEAAEVVAQRRRGSSFGAAGGAGGSSINKTAMTPQELLRQIVLQPMPTVAPVRQAQRKGARRSSASAATPAADEKNTTTTTKASGSAIVGDGRGMIVAVLDELDGLLTGPRGDALVGELFALAHATRSRLILIGIANSIDLVQQLMRPGGSLHRHNLRPEHEIFPAYLSSQVAELITQRLSRLPGLVFDPKTIQFCARKIANGSGDMRRALEACARAVSIVATEEQKKAAATSADAAGGQTSASQNIQPAMVGMRHMAAALAQVTGGIGASNDSVAAIRKLPVPQQLLMATVAKLLGERMGSRGLAVKVPTAPGLGGVSAAARFIGAAAIAQPLLEINDSTTVPPLFTSKDASGTAKKAPKMARNSLADAHRRRKSSIVASSKELTVGDLQAAHAGLCKRVGVAAYSQIEFNVAIDMLCTQGLVEVRGGVAKGPLQRVGLQIAEDDVLMALADVPVLKDVVGA